MTEQQVDFPMDCNTTNTEKRDVLLHVLNFRNLYGSGVTESVAALCRSQAQTGQNVLLVVNRSRPEWNEESFQLMIIPARKRFEKIGISSNFRREVAIAAKSARVVHCHDLWTFPFYYAARAAKRSGCHFVVSIHGTLSPNALRIKPYRKQLVWRVRQKRLLNSASLIHATSEAEYRDIRTMGVRTPVAIIPFGIDIPDAPTRQDRIEQSVQQNGRSLLYFGRIHPIKGLENLIVAWSRIQSNHPNWSLRICGVDDGGHKSDLVRLVDEQRVQRVVFGDPVFGNDRFRLYEESDIYILPSYSENFGNTVGEALASGRPVIASSATPWRNLSEIRCGWNCDPNVDSIVATLESALLSSPETLTAMGQRGKDWITNQYAWSENAQRLLAAYEWIEDRTMTPDFIKLA